MSSPRRRHLKILLMLTKNIHVKILTRVIAEKIQRNKFFFHFEGEANRKICILPYTESYNEENDSVRYFFLSPHNRCMNNRANIGLQRFLGNYIQSPHTLMHCSLNLSRQRCKNAHFFFSSTQPHCKIKR